MHAAIAIVSWVVFSADCAACTATARHRRVVIGDISLSRCIKLGFASANHILHIKALKPLRQGRLLTLVQRRPA